MAVSRLSPFLLLAGELWVLGTFGLSHPFWDRAAQPLCEFLAGGHSKAEWSGLGLNPIQLSQEMFFFFSTREEKRQKQKELILCFSGFFSQFSPPSDPCCFGSVAGFCLHFIQSTLACCLGSFSFC